MAAGKTSFSALERVACPGCGAASAREILNRADDLPIVQCLACGLPFLNPQPTQEALRSFYAAGYFSGQKHFFRGVDYFEARDKGLDQQSVTGWEEISALEVRGKRILDLGCASGALLALARANGAAYVKGIELDSDIAARGAARYGLDIAVGEAVLALAAEKGTFDIVCAFDFMEHVKNPKDLIRAVSRVLAPRGRFIIGVPNGECIEVWGREWLGVRENMEHLTYFRRADLQAFAADAGLKVEHVESRGLPLPLRTYNSITSQARWIRLATQPGIALCNIWTRLRYRLFGRRIGHELVAVFVKAD